MSKNVKKPSPTALQAQFKQAVELHQHGYLPQAEIMYSGILEANPKHVDTLHLLGVLRVQTQRAEQGVALIREAIAINGHQSAPHSNLGNALMALGRHDEAVASYSKAVALKPDFAEAWCNRGNALRELGRHDAALASYDKAVALNPRLADAYNNRGNCLKDIGRLDQALASYDQALALNPGHAEAHMNRASTLAALERHDEALASFDRAIALRPDFAQAWCNRGNARLEQRQFAQAADDFRQALTLAPGLAEAYRGLGSALHDLGDLRGSISSYQQALEIRPAYFAAHSSLLFTLLFDETCPPETYLTHARRFGEAATAAATPFTDWPALADGPEDGRVLRIGLVSGDLRHHPVGFFLESVLAALQGRAIELVAYPTVLNEDDLTARIKPFFTAWRPLAGLSDAAAARQIHDDRIHILVDLAGHTAHGRLPLFAWRPAPVQVSWLGYLASTGLTEMDHILVDPLSAPESMQPHFSERLWHLPEVINCLTPPGDAVLLPVSPLPALHRGHLTIGCFQNPNKVSDAALSTWAEVMQQLPDAQLRFQQGQLDEPDTRARLTGRLLTAGIDMARVSLHGSVGTRQAHLASHQEVDLILDTFPYPGVTTTCEALWMGVPTLTLPGSTLLSRQGLPLMSSVGLKDWVATGRTDFVQRAVRLASDVSGLAALRAGLRERASSSPLFNASVFAGQLEEAWRGMWRQRAGG